MRADQVFPQQPEPQRPEQAKPKLGEGHAAAMLRLGFHELTQVLAAFPDSNVKPMEEPGTLGNPTPQIVTGTMGHDAWLAERASSLPAKQDERGMSR